MRALSFIVPFAACLLVAIPGAEAQTRHVPAPTRHVPDFHGRDFGRFTSQEHVIWRGGIWRHDWHDGRFGWWWVLGPSWYFYPEPIYPYPTYVPPAIVVQQAPPVPSGLPPMQYWYYCDNPQGYYPYVASCSLPWREVPAVPPAAPSK